jgi:predicted lactoylglutathione lyase
MIGYLMLGTNDLEKAADFYERLFNEIGGKKEFDREEFVAWRFGEGTPMFCVTKPFDKNHATVGNGTMVAFKATNPKEVNTLHAKALLLGGTSDGDPGLREDGFYASYFRDLDGNKVCFFCNV